MKGGGGGRGFILTERVKTQKPKHYTRWGGVGGKGCFLKTTQILLVKFPCTTVKKKMPEIEAQKNRTWPIFSSD